METKQFKVIAVSSNTNSFGLKQVIFVAQDGQAFKACANSLNVPEKGAIKDVPINNFGIPQGAMLGYELTEQMPRAPKEIINEIFK